VLIFLFKFILDNEVMFRKRGNHGR
jgi:hypothetical protein